MGDWGIQKWEDQYSKENYQAPLHFPSLPFSSLAVLSSPYF
jgi:hypothetical protein